MRVPLSTMALALLVAGSAGGPSHAADYSDEARIKELEAENRRLKRQIEELTKGRPERAPRRADYALEDEEFEFLELGVTDDYMRTERFRTIDQINTFIPPLYQPAFVGHGYVLPPGAWRIGLGTSLIRVDNEDDWFKDGDEDFVHENHNVDRTRTDLDIFYGLDRNMTLRLNVPYWTTRSTGSVHPAGVRNFDQFVEASSQELGDISLILKKKWWDQGNYPFNLATVTGIKFPTGSNNEQFDQPMVVRTPGGLMFVNGGGPFPRFTDDGRLPSVLQPGTGNFGYIVGLMGTRQFHRVPSAFHAGAVARFLPGDDGVDPGDELRYFASYVKPILGEQASLDLAFNGMYKEDDTYKGNFTHPVPLPNGNFSGMFATTPRPSFRGGAVVFFSPSLIWTPQPQFRLTASSSFRLNEPDLGPWPGHIFRLAMTYTF